MRKLALVTILLVVGSGAAFALPTTEQELTAQAARLRIMDPSPLTVSGTGFVPAERVTVTYVSTSRTYVRRVVASTAGTFTARFVGVRWVVCQAVSLRAGGSRGSRAFVKIPPVVCPIPVDEP